MLEPQKAPPIPKKKGRPRTYPFAEMTLDQFVFIPGGRPPNVMTRAWEAGRRLGRRFTTRQCWAIETLDGWEMCSEEVVGATRGVAIWRVE